MVSKALGVEFTNALYHLSIPATYPRTKLFILRIHYVGNRNNAHFKRIDSNPFTVVRIIAGSGEIGNMLSISLSACNSFGASTGESALLYWNGSRFEIL